jgi:hypothetical protein
VLYRHFSSVSNLSQVIREFYRFKIGPEIVLAARWRRKAKMTSPFDSPTPILYRLSVEIFRLCLTVQKLFVYIYLAGSNWHPGCKIWGFLGVLAPKCNFLQRQLVLVNCSMFFPLVGKRLKHGWLALAAVA